MLPNLAAIAAGSLIAFQTQVSGTLGREIGTPVAASLWSFTSGGLILLVWTARSGHLRRLGQVRTNPFRAWWLVGGVSAALLVTSAAAFAPVIGVSLVAISVIAGQLVGSLAVDRLGLTPGGPRSLAPSRIVAALLAIAALTVASADGIRGVDLPTTLMLALVGAAQALGAAANGRLRDAVQDSASATLMNFAVGFTCIAVVTAAASVVDAFPVHAPGGPPWIWIGGAISATWVALSTGLVHRLGVLRLYLGAVAGQLIGSVALDAIAPLAPSPLGFGRVMGIVLVAAAVVLGSRLPAR